VIELYDLESDPKESTNIAAQHPDRVKHMKAALSAWQTGVVESLNGTDYQGSSAEQSSRGR